MCRMLGVSVSGYFDAQRRPAGGSARQIANAATAVPMAAIQKRHRGCYGRRRMHRELRNAGEVVNHKRVSRLMQERGLQSRIRRRLRVVTTDSKHLYPSAQNVLARDFSADAPNRKWLTDITYVSTDEGWLYCAFVEDLFSRKIVGWGMAAEMPQELTQTALRMALGLRAPGPGLVGLDANGFLAEGCMIKALRASCPSVCPTSVPRPAPMDAPPRGLDRARSIQDT